MAVSDWEELQGSPKITVDRQGGKSTRMFKIPWDDRNLFLSRTIQPNAISGYPAQSFIPGWGFQICQSVTFEPQIEGTDLPVVSETAYAYCTATVEYAPPPDDQEDNRPDDTPGSGQGGGDGNNTPGGEQGATGGQESDNFTHVTWDINVGGEFLTLPNLGLKWGTDDTDVIEDVHAGMVIPTIEHTVTWHRCRQPPWGAIRSRIGCVNSGSFMGAETELLLFLGAEGTQERTDQGLSCWTLRYKFSEKPLGYRWNFFFRSTTGQWERLKKKDGGDIYEKKSFTELWPA